MKTKDLLVEHKKELWNIVHEDLKCSHPWADDALVEILAKDRFKRIVDDISYDDYINDTHEFDEMLDNI